MEPATAPGGMRVALVHDFLLDLRGAERVLLGLCEMYPEADIFTAVYDPVGTHGRFEGRRVVTSSLQRLRPTADNFRPLLPFYPGAIEALDLHGYDLVVSSSSAWAHGVIPDEDAVHVCYCHNPFRYAWNEREATLAARGPVTRTVLAPILRRWRQWDFMAAQRVDTYVANSQATRQRIGRYFARHAEVVHPPVEISRFRPGPVGDYYLVLSELMAHKRIEVAVKAFSNLGLPLVVAGNGPDARRLQRMAGPTVRFVGRVSDLEAEKLFQGCKAFVVTATEEFGIAAVEAQAAGRPVIALRAGGLLETVVEGETGVFFDRPDPEVLAAAVEGFDPLSTSPERCVEQARNFEPASFRERFATVVDTAIRGSAPSVTDRHRPEVRTRAPRVGLGGLKVRGLGPDRW